MYIRDFTWGISLQVILHASVFQLFYKMHKGIFMISKSVLKWIVITFWVIRGFDTTQFSGNKKHTYGALYLTVF
jgi:hypothetical protein